MSVAQGRLAAACMALVTVASSGPALADPIGQTRLAPSDIASLAYTEPADQPHFARTGRDPALVFITGNGPSDTEYVDAGADPMRR